MVVASGPCSEGILTKLDLFRKRAKRHYVDTSTIISLNNKGHSFFDGQDQVNETHQHGPKYALVYVKQSGIGELKTGDLKPLTYFPSLPAQAKRLGGLDTVLIFRENTLGNIISDVRKLRNLNLDKILHTNTVLIYK